MREIKTYSIRGLAIPVQRIEIGGRTVDYWARRDSSHLIVTHDGQIVFDPKTATRRTTWRLAQSASEVFAEAGLNPPTIVAVFHSSGDADPHGRTLDLTPEAFFRDGMKVRTEVPPEITVDQLRGNQYLNEIFEAILPEILNTLNTEFTFENRALLGSSMGGLSTLYELGRKPERYGAALAFSPHWILGGRGLVERTISELPLPDKHRIWMSRGTRKLDREYEPHQSLADRLMREIGWGRVNFQSMVYRGAGHNERAWSKQVADALRFWLDR